MKALPKSSKENVAPLRGKLVTLRAKAHHVLDGAVNDAIRDGRRIRGIAVTVSSRDDCGMDHPLTRFVSEDNHAIAQSLMLGAFGAMHRLWHEDEE